MTWHHDLEGNSYLIATPEKALSDVLTFLAPSLKDFHDMKSYPQDNLRLDMTCLKTLDFHRLKEIKNAYKNKNLNLFIEFLEKNG